MIVMVVRAASLARSLGVKCDSLIMNSVTTTAASLLACGVGHLRAHAGRCCGCRRRRRLGRFSLSIISSGGCRMKWLLNQLGTDLLDHSRSRRSRPAPRPPSRKRIDAQAARGSKAQHGTEACRGSNRRCV